MCVAREAMFIHFSRKCGTPGRLIRLNYAIDMRYGVLFDIATRVQSSTPLDLTMGHVNVIWQGDANEFVLRALNHCTVPSSPLNVSGPPASVRWLAEQFGLRLGKKPVFKGTEASDAWLINTSYHAGEWGISPDAAKAMGYHRELEVACETLAKIHRRGIRVLPGGDYGFAWMKHGTNAKDLEYFVKYLGFTPMESLLSATKLGGEK